MSQFACSTPRLNLIGFALARDRIRAFSLARALIVRGFKSEERSGEKRGRQATSADIRKLHA